TPTQTRTRSAHEAYGARDAVVAEQHVGLDATARALEVHRQTERDERRARQLDPHKMPAVGLTEATALHKWNEVRRNLSIARRLRDDFASGLRDDASAVHSEARVRGPHGNRRATRRSHARSRAFVTNRRRRLRAGGL